MIVVDNFITNPVPTREYALQQPFTTTTYKGFSNFSGSRSRSFANADWIPFLEKHLPEGEKITWFETHPLSHNGAYQLCTAEEDGMASCIRQGVTDWVGVLFLEPEAPVEAGLTIYEQPMNLNDPNQWTVSGFAGNTFNRLVLFRGNQWHRASECFGLVQVFFFNTVSSPLSLCRWATHNPRILCLVMSTNRYDYFEQMLQSFRDKVSFDGCGTVSTIVFDDYPATRDPKRMGLLKRKYQIDRVIEHETNKGLPETWKEAWTYIKDHATEFDYVFHCEDDVVFEQPLHILDLIHSYTRSPRPLSQLFVKRHACYDPEYDFVTLMEQDKLGEEVELVKGQWKKKIVYQNWYFVAMCSLYHVEVACRYSAEVSGMHQENTIRKFYEEKISMTSAMYGGRLDTPIIRHIGEVSRGGKGSCFHFLPVGKDYNYKTGQIIEDARSPVAVCIPSTPGRRSRLQSCIDSIRVNAGYPHFVCIYENEGEGYVKAIRKLVSTLHPETLVWCIGDDVVLHEAHTLDRLVAAYHRQYPEKDGVVNPDDGIQHGAIMTTPLCTAKTFLQHYDERFFHYFADTLFTDIMRRAGKYTYCQDICILHNHPCNGSAALDETYTSTQAWYENDQKLYSILKTHHLNMA